MMNYLDEKRLDVVELQKLKEIATRPTVKNILDVEIQKLQTGPQSNDTVTTNTSTSRAIVQPKTSGYTVQITNYAWDQSEKFMKIYISIKGVNTVDSSKMTCNFTNRKFFLEVADLDGKNYKCSVGPLMHDIEPSESYHKIKTDTVLMMLKKAEVKKTWPYVTEREKKYKEKPVPSMDKDKPAAAEDGLMDMMKKMYDGGDDDMKRTIAKAWTESRDKQTP